MQKRLKIINTHIQKKNGKLKLYLDLSADPDLKNVPPESLFSTD